MSDINLPDGIYKLPYLFDHAYLWYDIASEMLMYDRSVQIAAVENYTMDNNSDPIIDDISITIDFIQDHMDLFECDIKNNDVLRVRFVQ